MMKNTHYVQSCLVGVFFGSAILLNGCSVFSFVGDSMSQGYENMVSYFNGYYNAQNLFNEAEDEIKTAALTARGKEAAATPANQIPATAKQKLGQVIDKCSNILAFHPSSGLVDNSLFLIGKSFFYQMEYLKAERKFIELLAQFPNSDLALETQLWYAQCEEKLGKWTEGIHLGDAVVMAAQKNNERTIESQAHLLLGELYYRTNEIEKSVDEYEKAISLSNDDLAKGEAQIRLGDIYVGRGQYDKAAEMYLRTGEYTSDIYSNYYSKLHASIAYREIGESTKSLAIINAMIEDFRYREYLPSILYEQANTYAASGRRDDAIDVYVHVDTAYTRTEFGIRSAYKLELIYEKELGQYALALKYDSVVNAATGLNIVAEGRRKFAALTRYFDAWHRLNKADSLFIVLSDTMNTSRSDTMARGAADSTLAKAGHIDSLRRISTVDSLSAQKSLADTLQRLPVQITNRQPMINADSLLAGAADTLHRRAHEVDTLNRNTRVDSVMARSSAADTSRTKLVQSANRSALPSADSLRILKSVAAQDLGDIFYSEILVPDSAFSWYNKSLLWNNDNTRSPRILYILAELSRTNPSRQYPVPEEYYKRLDHEFPESIYAEEARRFLQKSNPTVKTDSAAEYYVQAEKQLDGKEYDKAMATLKLLVQSFPKSPLAAKSEYAVGWIMEHCLGQPEKARAQYKRLIKNYEGTAFAQAASIRTLDIPKVDTVKIDTAKIKNSRQNVRPIRADSLQGSAVPFVDTTKLNNAQQVPQPMNSDSVQRSEPGVKIDSVLEAPVPRKNEKGRKIIKSRDL
jgi:cellulose synthase operon protein C